MLDRKRLIVVLVRNILRLFEVQQEAQCFQNTITNHREFAVSKTDIEAFVDAEGRDQMVKDVRKKIDELGIEYLYLQDFEWIFSHLNFVQ